jgi:glutaredoxin
MYTIYTKDNCSYCVRAKELLKANNCEFKEKNIIDLDNRSELLLKYPEAKTVPQIFVDNKYIGGYDNLIEYFKQTI